MVTQNVAATVSTTTLTTSYVNLMAVTNISLPSGWTSMDVQISGWVSFRCSGATTAQRRIDVSARDNGTNIEGLRQVPVPVYAGTTTLPPTPIGGLLRGKTGPVQLDLVAKVDNAADTIQALQWYVDAVLIRTS